MAMRPVHSHVLVCIFTLAPLAAAGPIAPPAGPVAPTQKTVITALPFTIVNPGSYVVWSDLTGVAGANGIDVLADDVTIDLNGFTLHGVVGSLNGISFGGFRRNLTIKNGTLEGWGADGVDGFALQWSRIVDVSATNCTGNGFESQFSNVFVRCNASGNGGEGFTDVGSGCVYENCTAMNNANGIVASSGSTIRGCTANNNNGFGIVSNGDGTITGCAADNNGSAGILAGPGTVVTGCGSGRNLIGISVSGDAYVHGNTCDDNTDVGIQIQVSDSRVENNLCTDNGIGIQIVAAGATGNSVIGNICRGNALNYDLKPGNHLSLIISELPMQVLWPAHCSLAGNLTGIAGADGIKIDADDVTIDLKGFALVGVPGSLSGVFVDTVAGNGRNVTIKNGSIRDWGGDGVRATGASVTTVSHIWCDGNASEGINVSNHSTVSDCVVSNHALNGISANTGCTVINCRARANLATGITVGDASLALNCTSTGNGDGYAAFEGSVIQDCTANGNTNFGAFLDFGSVITGCTIRNSGGSGIECLNECVVENNKLSFNAAAGIGAGINVVGSMNRIVGNSVISIPGGVGIGINVFGPQNTIYNNSGTNGAPDFQAVPGNDMGPIAPASAALPNSNVPY